MGQTIKQLKYHLLSASFFNDDVTFGKMSSINRRLIKSPQTSAIVQRVLNACSKQQK